MVTDVGPPVLQPEAAELIGLADQLLAAMSDIRRSCRRAGERPAVLLALSGAQLELVRLVRRQPGISVAQAAQQLNVAANTVSTLVGQLTEAGLVDRRPDESDRRVARLALTPEARDRVEAWRDRRTAVLAAAMGRLAPGERSELERVVATLGGLAAALHGDRGTDK